MSEEPTQIPEPTETPTVPQAQISETELEALRTDAQQYRKLGEEATELGFTDFQDMQDTLVNNYANSGSNGEPATPPPVTTPPPATPQAPAPQGRSAEDVATIANLKQQVQQSNTMAATAYLQADYTDYSGQQRSLPEEQRNKHSKKDLYAAISGPKGDMIRGIAQKDGTNLCAAAAEILAFDAHREAVKSGNTTTPLVDVVPTQLGEGGVPPAPKPKEGDRTPEQVSADEICPDEEFIPQT